MAITGIPIDENQCIGDSLSVLNSAFSDLDTRVTAAAAAAAAGVTKITAGTNITISPAGGTGNVTINATVPSGGLTTINTQDSANIDLGWNSTTSTLTADLTQSVKDSISTINIYQGKPLSIVADKFPTLDNHCGVKSDFYSIYFISKDGRLYGCGTPGSHPTDSVTYTRHGQGTWMYRILDGFRDITPTGLDAGDYVVEFWQSTYCKFLKTNNGQLWATGYSGYGNLGVGGPTFVNFGGDAAGWFFTWTKVVNADGFSHFAISNHGSSYKHGFYIKNGSLYGWGGGGYYATGLGTNVIQYAPALCNNGSIAGKTITKAFACGDEDTNLGWSFAIDSDRNVHFCGYQTVHGWGGTGDGLQKNNWVQLNNGFKADKIWSRATDAYATTYFLDGTDLYGCGVNNYGALGLPFGAGSGQAIYLQTPRLILAGVVDLFPCDTYNQSWIALMTDGTIRTCGKNSTGQLGTGNVANQSTPFNPGLTDIMKIYSQGTQQYGVSFALKNNNALYSCGYNGYGSAGQGDVVQSTTFQPVLKNQNNAKIVDITGWGYTNSAGAFGSLFKDIYGDLYACGICYQGCGGIPGFGAGDTVFGSWAVKTPQRCTIASY